MHRVDIMAYDHDSEPKWDKARVEAFLGLGSDGSRELIRVVPQVLGSGSGLTIVHAVSGDPLMSIDSNGVATLYCGCDEGIGP